MKKLVYNILQSEDENGVVLSEVRMQWSQANEEIVKKEAYDGYTIVEEDVEEVSAPTQLDKIEAQLTYTAMMTDTLLEV